MVLQRERKKRPRRPRDCGNFDKAAARRINWLRLLRHGTPVVAIFMLFALTGCTTLKNVDVQPADLQQSIRSSAIVKVGDRVAIATADDAQHRFKITAIDDVAISGKENGRDIAVPIDTIVGLKTREFSLGRTALLTGGVGFTIAWLLYIIAGVLGATAALSSA